jgi:hypothetical protein
VRWGRVADAALAHLLHRGLRGGLDAVGVLGAAEAGDARELVGARLGDLLQRAEAELVHRLRDGRRDARDEGERVDRLLLHLLELALGDDVELPVGELRREADVLPLAADGEGELLVGDDELHGVVGVVDDDARDLRRRDGVAHEAGRVAVVGDDVDALAAQLLHDGLDARALDAHAGAHRVDVASRDCTAIFERTPGSREAATIFTMPS